MRPAVIGPPAFSFRAPLARLASRRQHSICGASLRAPAGRPQSLQGAAWPVSSKFPSNPVPKGAVVDTLTTDDGVELRYARFPPNRSPVRGTVVLLHGRTEFIEKYFETVNDLRRRGFAVATFDSRGQGGSSRLLGNSRKGHVRDFADHVNDFETVHAGRGPAGLPAALLRARPLDRRGRRAPLRAAAAHADRSHGAHRAAACARPRHAAHCWRASPASSCISGLARRFRPAPARR